MRFYANLKVNKLCFNSKLSEDLRLTSYSKHTIVNYKLSIKGFCNETKLKCH